MKIDLHPSARVNYDQKGKQLLKQLVMLPIKQRSNRIHPEPELHVPTITDKDIIGEFESTLPYLDEDGNEIARFFNVGKDMVGLEGDGYQSLIKMAESIHKAESFRNSVSKKRIVDLIFKWLKLRMTRKISSWLVDYLISQCEQEVIDGETWLPIKSLIVEKEFQVGRITLKPVTKAMLDALESRYLAAHPSNQRDAIYHYMDRLRKQTQGKAVATMRLIAESERRYEIAVDEAERSCAVLRFYSPQAWSLSKVSQLTLFGTEYEPTVTMYTETNGLMHYTGKAVGGETFQHAIRAVDLQKMKATGLDALHGLLIKDKLTPFEERVLSAFLIYSKSPIATNYSDKLVPVLIALESLLLKDSQEPIKYSLGDRLALITEDVFENRHRVKEDVRRVYDIRSAFIHHGHTISTEHKAILTDFMKSAWKALLFVITKCMGKYKTVAEFVDDIDKIKLSGVAL